VSKVLLPHIPNALSANFRKAHFLFADAILTPTPFLRAAKKKRARCLIIHAASERFLPLKPPPKMVR
jgi:hypothetical protein